MRLDSNAKGVFTIAPTPFFEDGRIDWDSIDGLVDFYAACGVSGITVLGQMGEAPKLDLEEGLEIATRMIQRTSMPIVVGVSAPGFAAMKSLSSAVMDKGAAAVMIAPPNTLRTDDQIVNYFRQASEAIGEDVPWVLQDYPLTFSVVISPSVIRRIVTENPSCMMLKHEDWPGLEKISTLRSFERDASMRHISILCGNGGLFLDFEMERGADGAMTGYCFPEMLVDVIRLTKEGKRNEAHRVFDAHLPLVRYEQQPAIGLAVRKYVMMRRGLLTSDAQRKPRMALSKQAKDELDYLLMTLAQFDPRANFSSGIPVQANR